MATGGDTAQKVLILARDIITRGGYNALSYRTISDSLSLRTASIHYHYPEKADLGRAVIEDQHAMLAKGAESLLHSSIDARSKLDLWFDLAFSIARSKDQICLLGILEAEFETYPSKMQEAVSRLAVYQRDVVSKVLEQGRREGSLHFHGEPLAQATLVVTAIQGALQLTRCLKDETVLQQTVGQLKSLMK